MQPGEPVVLEPIDVEFDIEEVAGQPPFSTWLATKSGSETRASLARLIEPVSSAVEPRGLYQIVPVEETAIEAYDPPPELVSGSHLIVGVIALEVESPSPAVFESKVDTLVWDALENAALGIAREQMLTEVQAGTDELGFNTTQVFAPGSGSCEWPIETRRFMFEHLPTEQIGARLANGTTPDPPKTLAFAMGAGSDIEQAELLLSCAECDIIDQCVYAGAKTTA